MYGDPAAVQVAAAVQTVKAEKAPEVVVAAKADPVNKIDDVTQIEINRLMKQAAVTPADDLAMAAAGAPGMHHHGGMGGDETGALGMDDGALHLPGPRSYEKTLDAARNMISDDPKRVAQVVRKWISEDGRH